MTAPRPLKYIVDAMVDQMNRPVTFGPAVSGEAMKAVALFAKLL